jgi:hypothetical protein
MKTIFQALVNLFAGTKTKLVSAQSGEDVSAEQLEALGNSEQFAEFVISAQGERIGQLSAQFTAQQQAASDECAMQVSAAQKELAELREAVAALTAGVEAVAAQNKQLQADLQTAQQSVAAANAQADAVSKAVNLKKALPTVQPEGAQTANNMLVKGTHSEEGATQKRTLAEGMAKMQAQGLIK